MSAAYWSQWSHTELMTIHGVEIDDCNHEDIDLDEELEEIDEDSCPKCFGGGCNYCLMC